MVTTHPNTQEAVEAEKRLSSVSSTLALIKVVSDQIANLIHIDESSKSQEQKDLETAVAAELNDVDHANHVSITTREIGTIKGKIVPPMMAIERGNIMKELKDIYEDKDKRVYIASDRPLMLAVMATIEEINDAAPKLDNIKAVFKNDITLHDTSADIKVTNPFTKPCKVRYKSNGSQ